MKLTNHELTKIQEWLHKAAKASGEDCPADIRGTVETENYLLAEKVLVHLAEHATYCGDDKDRLISEIKELELEGGGNLNWEQVRKQDASQLTTLRDVMRNQLKKKDVNKFIENRVKELSHEA